VDWDGLFADLEAQAESLAVQERAAEIEERTRGELASISLAARLGAHHGNRIRCAVAGGQSLQGRLLRSGQGWLLLEEGDGREALIFTAHLLFVSELGREVRPAGVATVESRLRVNHVLRGLARDRSTVRILLVDAATLHGTIDRVGEDFLDLALHPAGELRRRDDVRGVSAVPLNAMTAVRRVVS